MKRISTTVPAMLSIAVLAVAAIAPSAFAATTANSQLTQQINKGVISTDIVDATGTSVVSPKFPMNPVTLSTTATQTSTGVFGTNAQRISVDNPSGSTTGGAWTLALNATTPGTGNWTNGTNTYAYNGASAAAGQLTVNPAAGTLTANVGGTTGITLGSSATFNGTTPITLATASSSASAIWNGYFTGIGLSQTIPAATPAGNYVLNMTQTVTAQ